jgi:NitT/TauT family transport system ATP-binding protein
MASNPILSLQKISKSYSNGTIALENLDLTIAQGEFVSIVGASGCGKSTVLRLIAGLEKASSGEINWLDRQAQQELAFVFQEAALMPWTTVLENIRLPLKLAGISPLQAKRRCQEAIALVGLQDFEHNYPRQLSGGMKMRVSIARALVTQPRVLLMDEPFGALDDITRSKLNSDLLSLWQQQQWTVAFVTHNISEAVFLSNRVIVMAARPGRVVADLSIDAPYPRTEDFRTSSLCNQYCREIAHCLQKTTTIAQ